MECLALAILIVLLIIYYKVFRIASDIKEIKADIKKRNMEDHYQE